MLTFIIIAIGEIFLGIFIYEFFNPQKRRKMSLFKYGLDLDAIFFDTEKDFNVINKANKFIFVFCILIALVTLINGILTISFDFIDIKDILLKVTLIAILPLRYIYIFVKR